MPSSPGTSHLLTGCAVNNERAYSSSFMQPEGHVMLFMVFYKRLTHEVSEIRVDVGRKNSSGKMSHLETGLRVISTSYLALITFSDRPCL